MLFPQEKNAHLQTKCKWTADSKDLFLSYNQLLVVWNPVPVHHSRQVSWLIDPHTMPVFPVSQ